jgi:hypothetical protein
MSVQNTIGAASRLQRKTSTMVNLELTPGALRVRILGWDIVYALRRSVTVRLAHVVGARARPPEADFDHAIFESWRGVGTYQPGQLAAGSVMLRDGRSFYDVHDPERAIAIDLEGEPYRHLVVEVDGEQPEATVERIEGALKATRRHAWLPPTA